jgi:hypothetical protein
VDVIERQVGLFAIKTGSLADVWCLSLVFGVSVFVMLMNIRIVVSSSCASGCF